MVREVSAFLRQPLCERQGSAWTGIAWETYWTDHISITANKTNYSVSLIHCNYLKVPINPISMILTCGKKHAQGEHAIATQKRPGGEPVTFLMWGDSVNHFTVMPFNFIPTLPVLCRQFTLLHWPSVPQLPSYSLTCS